MQRWLSRSAMCKCEREAIGEYFIVHRRCLLCRVGCTCYGSKQLPQCPWCDKEVLEVMIGEIEANFIHQRHELDAWMTNPPGKGRGAPKLKVLEAKAAECWDRRDENDEMDYARAAALTAMIKVRGHAGVIVYRLSVFS